MLSQIETSNRVSKQDLRINEQIIGFLADVRKHPIKLKNAEADAQVLVQEQAGHQRASIQSQLAERRQLVSSIRSEIEQMKAPGGPPPGRAYAQQARERAAAAAAAPAPIVSNGAHRRRPATTPSPVAAPSTAAAATRPSVEIAMRLPGIPCVYAGESPSGFDYYGLTMYVYAQVGISLPHNAAMQFGIGTPV